MSWGVFPGSWPARCFTSLCVVAPTWHYDRCAGFYIPGGQGVVASVCLMPLIGSQAHTHACLSSFGSFAGRGYKPIGETRES